MKQNSLSLHSKGHSWISDDYAFITTKYGHLDFYSKYKNLYTCGPHNGHSDYNFTSLEMAVVNALHLVHALEPPTRVIYPMKNSVTLKDIFRGTILVSIILLFLYNL